jgi:radical SAM family uncharacterized protein/radical SAM-linked protein
MIPLENIFSQISRHSRYLGNEVNSIHKDLDRMAVKFLLAFPDVYEIGMSHLGFQILYHILNAQEDVGAERVFAPWIDVEKVLRERDLPLFSLESRRPLSFFDIVGFSLQYELSYTNVLSMLDLGKIPLRSKHRNDKSPLIIAGGPCTFNPEPMAEFFDALVIGEGEEVILEIVNVFKEWKKKKEERACLLDRLTTISGVYVPSTFAVTYHPNGRIKECKPLKPGYDKVKKRIIPDLDRIYYPTTFIVPFMQIVHDHLILEVARGCTRGCRFCQAGMIYRPVRERSCSVVEKIAEEALNSTGWEELSVLSLSAGDYTGIAALLEGLIEKYSRQNISISFPSLRAETINSQWLDALEGGRKTGFTIAPEVGTERLRRIINKSLTETEILETCQQVFSAGWRSIKLYFMLGLPTETQEDLEGIVALAKKIFFHGKDAIKRPEVTISVSTFIPKPHTPFQWLSMIDAEEIRFRQSYLMSRLRKSRISFKWQDPEMSVLEGVIARGDRRLAPVIEEAFQNGARFDGWTELFNFPVWEKAFQKRGIPMGSYLSPTDETDLFPWDHIETGVTKDFLWQELVNAKMGKETSDCRWEACNQCGVCDFQSLYPRVQSSNDQKHQTLISDLEKKTEEKVKKIRFQFSKTHEARFLSHLEMARAFARAARRAALPLRYSQGFHPQPRIIFGPALAVGLESLDELVDIELTGDISVETVITSLNQQLPQGIMILTGKEIPLQTPAISDTIIEISYAISIDSSAIVAKYSFEEIKKIFSEFLSKTNFLLSKQHKGEARSIDFREAVKELIFSDAKTIVLTLLVRQAQGLRPREIMGTILGIPEEDLKTLLICKSRMKLRE